MVDLAGGLVVVEGLADLAAGQPAWMREESGVDLFGERFAGRAFSAQAADRGRSPGARARRSGAAADLALTVGEGVDEREADDVRLGAGGDLRDEPVRRFSASWR